VAKVTVTPSFSSDFQNGSGILLGVLLGEMLGEMMGDMMGEKNRGQSPSFFHGIVRPNGA
jgi:hypothetical protein